MTLRLTRTFSLALAATMLLVTAAAHAQFRTSVRGVVTDPTGAVIPNATLTLRNMSTNETVTRTSSGDGVFNFNALPADHFTLTASSVGFKKKVLTDLQLIPEQANSVNVQLELGDATTTVTVSADTAPAIDTETANICGTISSNDIQHTPSFNRDVFTLTQLAPGVISDGAQGAGGGVYTAPGNQGSGGSGGSSVPTENGVQANANGGQYETNSISIDGISTVSAVWGGASVITPSEESIDSNATSTGWYDTSAFDALAPTGSIAATFTGFPGSAVNSSTIINQTCTNAGLVEGVNCNTIAGKG